MGGDILEVKVCDREAARQGGVRGELKSPDWGSEPRQVGGREVDRGKARSEGVWKAGGI